MAVTASQLTTIMVIKVSIEGKTSQDACVNIQQRPLTAAIVVSTNALCLESVEAGGHADMRNVGAGTE